MTPYSTHIFVLSERALPRATAVSDANRRSTRERSRQRICARRKRRQRATRESRVVHLRNSSTDSSENRHRSRLFSYLSRCAWSPGHGGDIRRALGRVLPAPRACAGRSWPSCHRASASTLPPTFPLVSPDTPSPRRRKRRSDLVEPGAQRRGPDPTGQERDAATGCLEGIVRESPEGGPSCA
jgi:hypothetical protein